MDKDGATDIDLPLPIGLSDRLGPEFRPPRRLDASTLDRIGRELQNYYQEVLREPVPQRLLALVDQRVARRVFH